MVLEGKGTNVWINFRGETAAGIQHHKGGFSLGGRRLTKALLGSHQWACLARVVLPRA